MRCTTVHSFIPSFLPYVLVYSSPCSPALAYRVLVLVFDRNRVDVRVGTWWMGKEHDLRTDDEEDNHNSLNGSKMALKGRNFTLFTKPAPASRSITSSSILVHSTNPLLWRTRHFSCLLSLEKLTASIFPSSRLRRCSSTNSRISDSSVG